MELVPIPPVADELAARFAAAGHRLYLVGGTVRDALLGRPGGDLDFTTDARPSRCSPLVAGWAEAVWDTGIAFGTVGARRRGDTVEITTFRADAYDRVSRNPVVAFGDSIEDDLVRRDFTVNAMAVDAAGPERTFVDPYGGLAALAAGVLRHAGDARGVVRRRPAADAARRAVRQPARLHPGAAGGRRDDGDGRRARPDHRRAGAGRAVQAAAGAYPRRGLELLVDTGLAEHVLPELPAMRLEIDEHHAAQGRLPALARGARAGDRARAGRRPTSCCAWPRCCTTSASRRPAASSPTAG